MSKTVKFIPHNKGKLQPFKRKHPKKVSHLTTKHKRKYNPLDQNPMESIKEWADRLSSQGINPLSHLK